MTLITQHVENSNQKVSEDVAVLLLFVIIFLGQNIGIFYLVKRWISLSEVAMLLFVFFVLVKSTLFNEEHIIIYLMFNVLNMISFVFALDKSEAMISAVSLLFYSTFALFLVAYLMQKNLYEEFLKSFLIACSILAVYGILQFVLIRVLGFYSDYIVYPFGNVTVQRQPITLSSILVSSLWRSNSLYYEPSIYAMTLVLGFSINETLKFGKLFFKLLMVFGVIVSFSLTAYIMLVLVYALSKLYGTSFLIDLKRTMITIVILIAVIIIIPYLIETMEALPYPFNRLSEVFIRGTSGYYRLVTPIFVTGYVLSTKAFGIGIGGIDSFLKSPPSGIARYLIMGSGYGRTIDSVPFVILLNYGYLGFILLAFLLIILFRSAKKWLPFSAALFLYLLGTGNYSSANFWIILSVLLVAYLTTTLENECLEMSDANN